jgi:hypothetical protein
MDEGMDGHEFDRCHAQFAEIIDHPLFDQRGKGPLQLFGNVRPEFGEPFYVHLVDDQFVPSPWSRPIAAPREGRVHDFALGHERSAVPNVKGEILVRMAYNIAEQGVIP